MASSTGQKTIYVGGTVLVTANTNRKKLAIYNAGTAYIYIGGTSGVVATENSATGGFPIPPKFTFNFDDFYGTVYATCGGGTAGGTASVHYMQEELS